MAADFVRVNSCLLQMRFKLACTPVAEVVKFCLADEEREIHPPSVVIVPHDAELRRKAKRTGEVNRRLAELPSKFGRNWTQSDRNPCSQCHSVLHHIKQSVSQQAAGHFPTIIAWQNDLSRNAENI